MATNIEIRVTATGAQTLGRVLTFPNCSQVNHQSVSEYDTRVSFQHLGKIKTFRVVPTPQPQAKFAMPPNSGHSDLRVRIKSTGKTQIDYDFHYAVQHLEWITYGPDNKDVNFIPVNQQWWKWRLYA